MAHLRGKEEERPTEAREIFYLFVYKLQSLTIYLENKNWCSEKIPMHLLSPAALCCVLKLQITWKARLSWNCSRMKHINIFFILPTICEMCPLCVWLFIRLCISRVPQLTYIPGASGLGNPTTLYVRLLDAVLGCIYMRLCVSVCVAVCVVYTVCVCVCVVFMRGRWRCPSTAVDEQKHWNRRSKCSWHRVFLLKGMM